jgi:hypothetical protein
MQAVRRAEAPAEQGLQGERVHNARSHTEWIAENKTEQLQGNRELTRGFALSYVGAKFSAEPARSRPF